MNLQSCKFYGMLILTAPATPLLCMRTEAGQLLVEMVYNNVVTALRKHPAAGIGFIPIPCFYGIMIMSSYAKALGITLGTSGPRRGSLSFEGSLLFNLCYNNDNSQCEGGRQMASVKLLVKPESLCIPCGTHNKLTESRVSG